MPEPLLRRHLVLAAMTAAAIIAVVMLEPIAQDPLYHGFADQRAWLGIPNAANVLSNLAFLAAGGAGLVRLRRASVDCDLTRCLTVFFAGVVLTAAGSAWYHLAPDNRTLLWDRLPMTLAFMGLFAAVIVIYVSAAFGRRLLIGLLALGLASVLFWFFGETAGRGDLRPYLLVQFLPLVLIPLILGLYQRPTPFNAALLGMLGLYLLAKGAESVDARLFEMSGSALSGHTVKHLLAAIAAWLPAYALAGTPVATAMDAEPAAD